MKLSSVFSLLAIFMTGCISDGQLKRSFATEPLVIDGGWPIAAPGEVGLHPDSLASVYRRFLDENAYYNAKSLLVISKGKLVAENYCRSELDRTNRSNIQSITKSVTALLWGVVLERNRTITLDTPLVNLFPAVHFQSQEHRNITIKHCFTMRSGIDVSNFDYTVDMLMDKVKNPVQHLLSRSLYAEPGTLFRYRDCDAYLASASAGVVMNRDLSHLLREQLLVPLGINNVSWESDVEGCFLGSGGLFLTPRDLAKIGQLVIQRGNWDGKQLIPSAWIDSMLVARTPPLPQEQGYQYGYFWWIVPQDQVVCAWGNGGQFLLIDRKRELLIVMTSLPSSSDKVGTHLKDLLPLYRTLISGGGQ